MANTIRGQIPFTAGASAYVLLFDINALAAIQNSLGIKIAELEQVMEGGDIVAMREVFRVGLQRHHPEITAEQAGDVMHEVGIEEVVKLMERAFTAAFPEAAKNPPKAPKTKPGTSSAS